MALQSTRAWIRVVAGINLLVLALLVAPGAQAQTVAEIVEASLEAVGGREALAGITSLRQVGGSVMSTDYGDLEGDTEGVIIPNQKIYQDLDSDFFQQTNAWNGTVGWQSDSMQGMTDATGEQVAVWAAQASLHPFQGFGDPALGEYSKLDDAEVGGRPHHVVQITAAVVTFDVYVDTETYLVSRMTVDTSLPQLGTVRMTLDVEGYQEHGGVLFPTITGLAIPGAFSLDTVYDTVEVNGEVDHNIFEKP